MTPVAVALVVAWVALTSAPALADQVRLTEWWLPELHITAAQQTSQGSGVTIAVLDTGVDAAAPDLAGSVLAGPDLSHSGRAANGPFFGVRGTEIASIIAGHGHGPGNGDGLIGVAPAAKILSVRVALDSGDPMLGNPAITGGLPAAIASGIRYATNNGASVIDLPLDPAAAGAAGPAGLPSLAVSSPAERSAVAYARSKGVMLVAPAGDDGAGAGIVNYPAAYHGVISVGAFDQNFTKAPFSSHQPYVTMTAAGDGIAAETPSGYTTVGSTSAASAVVAGIAALIRSAFPALTPAQVTKSLISSTRFRRPNGRQIGSGYGTVDALGALRAATAMAEPHGQRAFAGSAARVAPMIPSVRAARNDLRAKLERDAILSAGVLLILLVPAVVLAIVRRRSRAEDSEFDDSYDDLEQQLANAVAGLSRAAGISPGAVFRDWPRTLLRCSRTGRRGRSGKRREAGRSGRVRRREHVRRGWQLCRAQFLHRRQRHGQHRQPSGCRPRGVPRAAAPAGRAPRSRSRSCDRDRAWPRGPGPAAAGDQRTGQGFR